MDCKRPREVNTSSSGSCPFQLGAVNAQKIPLSYQADIQLPALGEKKNKQNKNKPQKNPKSKNQGLGLKI